MWTVHFSRTRAPKLLPRTPRATQKFPEMSQRARLRQGGQDWKELEILWVKDIA